MPREALPVGTAGEITTLKVDGGYRAVCRYRGWDGKRKDVSRIRETAGAARTAVRQAVSAGLSQVKEDSGTTVGSYVTTFASNIESHGFAGKTNQDYGYASQRILDSDFASVNVTALTVAKIKTYLTAHAKAHGSGATRHVRAVLKHSLEAAVEAGELTVNPVSQIRERSKKVTSRPVHEDRARSLTTRELAVLLWRLNHDPEALRPVPGMRKQGAGKDVVDLITFLFATGARVGEALGVRWSDVHVDQQGEEFVDFNGKVVWLKSQGTVRQDYTKTTGSTRVVPLPRRTVALLARRQRALGAEGDLPVFGSPYRPDRWRDPNNLSKAVRKLFDRYGVDWGSTHLGRRYRVTNLVEQGIPLNKVADLVGHSSINTTLKYVGRSTTIDPEVRKAL